MESSDAYKLAIGDCVELVDALHDATSIRLVHTCAEDGRVCVELRVCTKSKKVITYEGRGLTRLEAAQVVYKKLQRNAARALQDLEERANVLRIASSSRSS